MSNPTELPDLDALLADYGNAAGRYTVLGDVGSHYNDMVGARNAIRDLFARRAQPEGEAPQAEPVAVAARALLNCCDGLKVNSTGWLAAMAEFDRTRESLRAALAAQQAAAPGAQVDRWSWSKRGMELDPNGHYATYSAPGTPEAPAEPTKAMLGAMISQADHLDVHMNKHEARQIYLAALRAAQLDGGQEGSGS